METETIQKKETTIDEILKTADIECLLKLKADKQAELIAAETEYNLAKLNRKEARSELLGRSEKYFTENFEIKTEKHRLAYVDNQTIDLEYPVIEFEEKIKKIQSVLDIIDYELDLLAGAYYDC